jgi:hypothetical protein
VSAALRSAALMFTENVGQFDERARFQVRGGNATLYLVDDALWFTVWERPQVDASQEQTPATLGRFSTQDEDTPRQGVNLKLSFVGATPPPRLDTHVSYFIGNDPAKWHTDVPVWGGVRYVDLYPAVDLEVTSEGGQWAWRLVVRDSTPTLAPSPWQGEGARVGVCACAWRARMTWPWITTALRRAQDNACA